MQRVALTTAIGDTLPPILLDGQKPSGVTVATSALAVKEACGGVVAAAYNGAFNGKITNDPGVYYVDQYGGSEHGQARVLMQLESSRWQGGRWILLTLPHPDMEFNGNPTVRRFDLTPPLLRMLGASAENSILCPSTGSQG